MAWKGDSRRHSLARKGVKTVRKPMKAMGKRDFGSSLSTEGKALLKTEGFSEEYVPFIWKSELDSPPSVPHYMTVDFVLDSEMREEFNEIREDEDGNTSEWLSHNLWELIDRGLIVDVYENINSPEELKEKYDDIVLIYGRG